MKTKSTSKNMKPLKLLAAALAIAAVVKELRLPKEERAWHGALAGIIPYDFRKPTLERFKNAFWNAEGGLISNRPFGVGWTVNLGGVVARLRSLSSTG